MKCKDERAYKDCYNGMSKSLGYSLTMAIGLEEVLILYVNTVVRLDLITATAAISGFASVLFGLLTNLPVALA